LCPTINKTLAYYEICPFVVHYGSVIFYSAGPRGLCFVSVIYECQFSETFQQKDLDICGQLSRPFFKTQTDSLKPSEKFLGSAPRYKTFYNCNLLMFKII
jgi:hypothetical protein